MSSAFEPGQVVTLDGKQCLEGSSFYFDVDEHYAFDIDETVQLEVELYQRGKDAVVEAAYERNGAAEVKKAVEIPAYRNGTHVYKLEFVLDRARFANRSLFGTDFSIE